MLQITYYPTLYYVCPNRILTEFNQIPAADIYNAAQTCAQASGTNNAFLVNYSGIEGSFCNSETFAPGTLLQNLGTDPITSASIDLVVNGEILQTEAWTGELNTFQTIDINFEEITLTENADIQIVVTSVNGTTDDDESNNIVSVSASLSMEIDDNILTFELQTDQYAAETYWQILDENSNVLYGGGNNLAIGGTGEAGVYENETLYTFELPLPQTGCYDFEMYDLFGDGICCAEGAGFYRLTNSAGEVVLEGGEFGTTDFIPFNVTNAVEVSNNAAIVTPGESADICAIYPVNQSLIVQNLGSNEITEMVIEIAANGTVIENYEWTGSAAPGNYAFITLEAFDLEETTDITYRIASVNNQPDDYGYGNQIASFYDKKATDRNILVFEFLLNDFAYEVYWQFTDDAGTIIASGGNELVGAAPGLYQEATPDDPGAYIDFEMITEEIVLPADANLGCYELLLKDGYGDGNASLQSPSNMRLSDDLGNVLHEEDLMLSLYETQGYTIHVDALTSNTELTSIGQLSVYPNPVNTELLVNFSVTESTQLSIEVYDLLGRAVTTVEQNNFGTGNHKVSVDVSGLTNGIYFISLTDGEKQTNKKFIVSH